MVVPSEKNAEIFNLVMDKSDSKPSALQDSPSPREEDKTLDSTMEVVATVDNISGDEHKIHTDNEDFENENSGAINTSIIVPVIIEEDLKDDGVQLKAVVESQSFLSLSHSEDSLDGVTEDSASAGLLGSKDISFEILASDRHLSTNSIDFKDIFETKSVDSTLFENTQEPLELGCDESHDISREVFDIGDEVCKDTLGVQKDESPSTYLLAAHHSPPRSQITHSPLLTSTPHSLPPMPRTRVSSTPCAPPSPLTSPYASSPLPLDTTDGPMSLPTMSSGSKSYDYLLKVLLVGDSDVGKQEILSGLEDGSIDSPYCSSTGAAYKTTIILIDGKRVKLQLWDTSGQGRFCTIIRSYSRGAQGILLVYDITNKWSFEGMDRWVAEVEEHAPGIPKVLVGNRLHLAFKRQVDQSEAESYADRNHMGFYEVSPLVNFNITESFQELSRMALKRNGMERLWRSNKVLSLHELCCHSIVARTNVYGIDKLPLPDAIKANLKSYAMTNNAGLRQALNYKTLKERKKKSRPPDAVGSKCVNVSRKSCVIS
eukprot:GFUD01022663.1.p1 GENE.GFUD01022663.1~~GFUD01022663.1.p1  ORF type:complete len:543 (-),score=116.65 GFUD01022663.1:205-1833(-)